MRGRSGVGRQGGTDHPLFIPVLMKVDIGRNSVSHLEMAIPYIVYNKHWDIV